MKTVQVTSSICPECGGEFSPTMERCPEDGTPLQAFSAEPPDDDLLGAEIDARFRIDSVLGEGGMGRVYSGKQLSVGRDVAIKVLHPALARQQHTVKRFFREAQVISKFAHPNIVNLIDFGQDQQHGVLYLVMEFIDGTELGELLDHHRLHIDFAVEVMIQTCQGLSEAHDKEVVHRDLKPDNLMLFSRSDGRVQAKVVDFGIAEALQDEENLTKTGTVVGTTSYMAPDQIDSGETSPQTDIYSLGCIFFEMLTGLTPFAGESSMELLMQHVKNRPPSLSDLMYPNEQVEELSSLIDEMLRKSPEKRPDSVLAIRDRLELLQRDHNHEMVRLDDDTGGLETFSQWLAEPLSRNQNNVDPETGEIVRTAAPTVKEPAVEPRTSREPTQVSREVPEEVEAHHAEKQGREVQVPAYDDGADPDATTDALQAVEKPDDDRPLPPGPGSHSSTTDSRGGVPGSEPSGSPSPGSTPRAASRADQVSTEPAVPDNSFDPSQLKDNDQSSGSSTVLVAGLVAVAVLVAAGAGAAAVVVFDLDEMVTEQTDDEALDDAIVDGDGQNQRVDDAADDQASADRLAQSDEPPQQLDDNADPPSESTDEIAEAETDDAGDEQPAEQPADDRDDQPDEPRTVAGVDDPGSSSEPEPDPEQPSEESTAETGTDPGESTDASTAGTSPPPSGDQSSTPEESSDDDGEDEPQQPDEEHQDDDNDGFVPAPVDDDDDHEGVDTSEDDEQIDTSEDDEDEGFAPTPVD